MAGAFFRGKVSMLGALHFPSFCAGLIVADIAPIAHDMGRFLDLATIFKSMPMNNIINKYECIDWLKLRLPQFSMFELQFLLTNLIKEKHSDKWKWRINFDAIEDNLHAISRFNHSGYNTIKIHYLLVHQKQIIYVQSIIYVRSDIYFQTLKSECSVHLIIFTLKTARIYRVGL